MTFYETMKLVMDERGIKPADLCERTGFHPSYFSKLKSGHMRDVSWDRAIAIILALDMTPDEFYARQSGDAADPSEVS